LLGGSGSDTLIGGPGADTVVATADVNFTLSNTSLTGQGTDTLSGIESAVLTGGNLPNVIDASAFTLGPVSLSGRGGNDTLKGGTKDDLLDGGDGNDQLFGNDGNDTFTGGAGNDQIQGGSGIDTLV